MRKCTYAKCPKCKGELLEWVYKQPDTNSGWGLVYCPECLIGAHLCRLGDLTDEDDSKCDRPTNVAVTLNTLGFIKGEQCEYFDPIKKQSFKI